MSSDPVVQWSEAYERTSSLVAGLDADQLATHVPACPDWTVRDLLSHMVGLGADVLAGDEPDDHNEAWTRRQVESRVGRSAADLLTEWRGLAGDLAAWMRETGNSRPLNDVVIHEQDLRGAVGAPGARRSPGLRIVRDRMAGRFAAAAADLPPLAMVAPTWTWRSDGATVTGEEAVRLEASEFDLTRSLMSRRTERQVRSWVVAGDVTPYLPAFSGLGPLPGQPLPE